MLEIKKKPSNSPASLAVGKLATALTYAEPRVHFEPDPAKLSSAPGVTRIAAKSSLPLPRTPDLREHQTRVPVIVGEAHYKGSISMEGIISGQLGSGASLNVRQWSKAQFTAAPELSGELSFRDMLRVNGYIAGTVYSKTGTLIVDTGSRVDANVEVGVAVISGCINGDIIAHQRVEIGPNAKIHGNIWTRSLEIKDGAIFEGVCKMIGE